MNSFKTVTFICMQNFRKWTTNYRIWVLFIFVAIFVNNYTKQFVDAAELMNLNVTPWMFPFLSGPKWAKIFIYMGILLLFCDAPFIDNSQPYVIIRSGRFKWGLGQILYIIISSAVYFLFIMLSTVLLNIGHLEFSNDWGKAIGTIGMGYAGSALAGSDIVVNRSIVEYFTPLQAMWFTFLLSWLAGTLLGLIIYALNTITNTKTLGFMVSGLLIFLEFLGGFSKRIKWGSPLSWTNLYDIEITGTTGNPTIQYIITMFSVLIIGLIIISVLGSRRKQIEVIQPI